VTLQRDDTFVTVPLKEIQVGLLNRIPKDCEISRENFLHVMRWRRVLSIALGDSHSRGRWAPKGTHPFTASALIMTGSVQILLGWLFNFRRKKDEKVGWILRLDWSFT
jgi:hypothetical protein